MKQTLSDLAIFGGNPAFAQPLYVGRPNIGDRQKLLERINNMLDRRWFSNNGPYVQEFEQAIAAYLGVKHCIAICNATVALEIAIRALGMTGEVIVPSFTFIATPHSLQWQQITPVFCDVDPKTHCLDPRKVESLITPKTSGIIGVHIWGTPCAIEELTEICQRRNLRLLFDAAHAFGCSFGETMIGNFGDAEVFSFHATKFINSFEGGAIVTNNDELAKKIRLMTNFGFAGYDEVIYIGTNGKMSEASAAMGLTSLESMDEIIAANHRNYQTYQTHLKDLPGLQLFQYPEQHRQNYQYIVLQLNAQLAGLHRDELQRLLWAEQITARRYFYPGCHRMEPYRSYFPHAYLLLPETETLVQQTLLLPNGTTLSQSDVETICQLINFIFANAADISTRLQREAHD
ncbi:MAG: aminotransferase class I/II-fold pyridoxal phosphate-dependent enzyme [Anaerolinea sp.]|nr:aminotransferase class I/II-fold pyridoxal phosphate-dependent enzyme [Anaerolinea sp.]